MDSFNSSFTFAMISSRGMGVSPMHCQDMGVSPMLLKWNIVFFERLFFPKGLLRRRPLRWWRTRGRPRALRLPLRRTLIATLIRLPRRSASAASSTIPRPADELKVFDHHIQLGALPAPLLVLPLVEFQ